VPQVGPLHEGQQIVPRGVDRVRCLIRSPNTTAIAVEAAAAASVVTAVSGVASTALSAPI
jgi:hypothetical protein